MSNGSRFLSSYYCNICDERMTTNSIRYMVYIIKEIDRSKYTSNELATICRDCYLNNQDRIKRNLET